MRHALWRAAIAVAAIVALALGAAQAAPARGGKVVVTFPATWETLDPHATANTLARDIMGNLYDPLLFRDFETGALRPGLAQSWSVSPNGRVILMRLRRGVRFHDGTPFNAQAVAFAFDRIKDPALRSPMAATILGPIDRVEVRTEYAVAIVLKAPFAPFLDSLSEISLAPVSPAAARRYGKDFGQHPVGTGPFMFRSTEPGQRVTLVRNPNYNWASPVFAHQGPAYLDELEYVVVPEDGTRMAMLESGQAQVVYNPPNREVKRLEGDQRVRVRFKQRPGVPRVIVLNTQRFPFDDARVRQAVAYATDKEALLRTVYEGIGGVANSPLSPGTFGYGKDVDAQAPRYDPNRARQVLAEAGWRPGPDGIMVRDGRPLRFRLWTTTVPQQIQDAQLKQAQLRAVGMDAVINQVETAAFLAAIRRGDHEMAGMLFVSTDPDVLFTISHSSQIGAGWNTAFYRNPEHDRLLEQGRTTLNPTQRIALYRQAQLDILRDAPYVPFYVIMNPYLTAARVDGFKLDARAFMMFYDVSVR